MKRNASKVLAAAGALLCLTLASASAATITFEGTVPAPESYRNGSDVTGGYAINAVTFKNNYYPEYGSWDGFSLSNTTNVSTGDYTNQYSSFTGGGADGSSTYAVAYASSPVTISFDENTNLSGLGASFTNTTYGALVVRNGNGFSRAFETGDWFKLTITGYLGNTTTGTFDFFLADYTSEAFVLSQWQYVDFSTLGTVDKLQFSLSSTDNGMWGMNTPAYFAMDNFLAVPEPGTLVFAFISGFGLLVRRRR